MGIAPGPSRTSGVHDARVRRGSRGTENALPRGLPAPARRKAAAPTESPTPDREEST